MWIGHLAVGLARSAPPLRGGRRMTSPRGTTAARPLFFILRLGARPLGFIDFSAFEDLSGSWGTLGASSDTPGGLLGALGGVLRPLRALLGRSWGLSGGSWGGLGASWAPLRPSWGDLGES